MPDSEIRFERELLHFQRILSFFDDTVARIILEEIAEGEDLGVHSRLLEQGCRILQSDRCRTLLADCRSILGTGVPATLMEGPGDSGLARAVSSPAAETPNYIILSPQALTLADGPLSFILGHELAHIAFEHHVLRWIIDTVYPPSLTMPPYLENEYSIWKQCAELSADRAGFRTCGNFDEVRQVIGLLEGSGLPAPEDRMEALEETAALDRTYRKMFRKPEDSFQQALVSLLSAAGELLARSDGIAGDSEKAYLINRISRICYVDPEENRPAGDRAVTVASAGRIIREQFPERREEAFLNLAVIIVRDGRVTDDEYRQLMEIASEHLGIDTRTARRVLLRVFRSGYYSPFEE